MEIYNWIKSGIVIKNREEDFKLNGNRIKNSIPCVFAEYLYVYHPINFDLNQPDILEEELNNKNKLKYLNQIKSKIADHFDFKGTIKEVKNKEELEIILDQIIKSKYPKYGLNLINENSEDPILNQVSKELSQIFTTSLSENWANIFTINKTEQKLISKSWSEYARKLNLVFHNEINWGTFIKYFNTNGDPINLVPPREDYLPDNILKLIVDKIHDKYGDIKMHLDYTYNETIELSKLKENPVLSNLFVPVDKSWIIHTPSDLRRTIIGGDKTFIQIIRELNLEVLSINKETRIDYFGDKINPTFIGYNN